MTTSDKVINLIAKAKRILYVGFLVIVLPAYFYLYTPIINPWFPEFSFSLLWLSAIVASIEVAQKRKSLLFKITATTAVVSGVYIAIMWLASWSLFRASAYHAQIGEVKTGESFSKDIRPISVEKIRIVDEEVAQRLGDKVLGEDMALGSRVTVGKYDIQKIKDELYWVAPLLHSGFYKWWSNSEGTPAYIMVSATNERDVRLVQKTEKGAPIKVKYQPEGYFGDNLYRHLYLSGYLTTGMTDFTFEIDDEGTPYWVVSLYMHEIGFSGDNVYGVAVVNAETGEIQQYTPENAPAWIDRIQPKEIVKSQLDAWGEYVHGFWNFSNKDKLMTTDGISLVYGEDSVSYYYTGLSSVGADEGTIGFVLVNTRTKAATWYRQAGATENAAQGSAEGKVQEKGFSSSFPVLYNVNGVATYVMSLKDKGGLIKMIAMVSVEDYSIVGVGDNLKEALRSYKDAFNSSGNKSVFANSITESHKVISKVARINQDIVNGNSYYYFTLESVKNKIFSGSSTTSPEIPLTQAADSVMITYDDARNAVVDIVSFDNFGIKTVVTDSVKVHITQ